MNVFPYYLSIGMSADEFWHGEPWLVQAYYKAHKLRNEQRNQELWMQGLYIYNAFGAVLTTALSKNHKEKYIDKPIELYPKPKSKQEIENERKREQLAKILNSWKKGWEKNQSGKTK